MGDYAPAHITIFACPPEQAPVFMRALQEESFGMGWGDYNLETDALVLGHQYCDDQASTTIIDRWADLPKEAPDATFAIYADPVYEYNGEVLIHSPALGTFRDKTDSNGNVIRTLEELTDFLYSGPHMDIVADLEMHMGKPWVDQITALRKQFSEMESLPEIPIPKEDE